MATQFTTIPTEIIIMIMKDLPSISDTHNLALSCRRIEGILKDPAVTLTIYKQIIRRIQDYPAALGVVSAQLHQRDRITADMTTDQLHKRLEMQHIHQLRRNDLQMHHDMQMFQSAWSGSLAEKMWKHQHPTIPLPGFSSAYYRAWRLLCIERRLLCGVPLISILSLGDLIKGLMRSLRRGFSGALVSAWDDDIKDLPAHELMFMKLIVAKPFVDGRDCVHYKLVLDLCHWCRHDYRGGPEWRMLWFWRIYYGHAERATSGYRLWSTLGVCW